jgi:hypothetical protein
MESLGLTSMIFATAGKLLKINCLLSFDRNPARNPIDVSLYTIRHNSLITFEVLIIANAVNIDNFGASFEPKIG